MKLSSLLFRGARQARDIECVLETIEDVSPDPILRRIVNKFIGRNIVSRLWMR